MELKPGYKRTDVGVIPQDWSRVPIASVARLESGHTPSKRNPSYWGGPIGWVSLHDTSALGRREINMTSKTITEEGLNHSSARLLPAGTVVFSRTATVGKTTVMACPMATSQDFANYVCGPNLHNHFLVYMFRGMGRTWKQLMAGSIHNTIYMPVFKALKITLPPLPEQRAIAEALSDADALLDGLDRLIAKKRNLKQATMQQLLTGKTRLPGFSGKWEVKPLRDALTVRHGRSQREVEADDGPYPILATGGQIGRASRPLFDKPSVLIGRKGTIDKPQYMGTPFWTVDTLFYCEMKDGHNARWFFYLFCTMDWLRFNEASGVPSLNSRTIESIDFSCPPSEEQAAIAAVLSDMDAEFEALEARRDKVALLKHAMMQELLTGKTRLVAPEPAHA
jgi:type I restriction enzyme S subunit